MLRKSAKFVRTFGAVLIFVKYVGFFQDAVYQDPSHLYNSFKTAGLNINPYPTAFPYGIGMVLHFYQQQESSTTKTVHKVINKGLKAYV